MNKLLSIGAALLVSGCLAGGWGCGEKGTAPTPRTQQEENRKIKKKTVEGETPPEAVTKTVEPTYRFRAEGKRDPFYPFIKLEEEEASKAETPLERFDIYQFKLAGVIAGREAMLGAPDGMVYYVKVGTPIGRHNGKVVRITRNEVVVLEKYIDFYGRKKEREVVIRFPEKE